MADDETEDETSRRARQDRVVFEERKKRYLAESFKDVGLPIRKRLEREFRIFTYFLVVLLAYILVMFFSPDGLVLVEGAHFMLEDQTLPESVYGMDLKFKDVMNTDEIIRYLESTLIDAIYSELNPGYMLNQNVVLGGARIRQLRTAKVNDCSQDIGNILHSQLITVPCFPPWAEDTQDTANFGSSSQYSWTSAEANGAVAFGSEHSTQSSFTLSYYPGSGYVVLLGTTRADMFSKLRELNSTGFYDKFTQNVFIEFATYNPSINLHLSLQLMFERQSSGTFINQGHYRSFKLWPFALNSTKTMVILALEVILVIMISGFVIMEGVDMFTTANMAQVLDDVPTKEHVPVDYWKRPFYYLIKLYYIWEFIHLANITTMVLLVYFRVQWAISSAVADYDLETARTTWQNHYPFGSQGQFMHSLSALNVWLSIIKLLKYLQLSRRLNILALTVARARPFLAGFSFMFVLVFFGFALMGFVVFGPRFHAYSSLFQAIRTVFGFMFGIFDFRALQAQNPFLAPVFFYGFLIIVVFVMINIFIAIVNNSFKDVSNSIRRDDMKDGQKSMVTVLFGNPKKYCRSCRTESKEPIELSVVEANPAKPPLPGLEAVPSTGSNTLAPTESSQLHQKTD